MNSIIFVCEVHDQSNSRWNTLGDLQWCRERLPAQYTEADIKAYWYEDLVMQASAIGTVDKAAKDLLSELDGSKRAHRNLSSNNPNETEDLSSPELPLLFICQGFAGLVVKRVPMLSVVYAVVIIQLISIGISISKIAQCYSLD